MDQPASAFSDVTIALVLMGVTYIGILIAAASWRIVALLVIAVSLLQIHFLVDVGLYFDSFNVFPFDMLAIVLSLAGAMRFLMRGRLDLITGCWLALAGSLLLALLRGASSVGLATAVVSFRPDLYFIASALYTMSFTWSWRDLDRFANLWLLLGSALAAYALVCWIAPSMRLYSWMLPDESGRLAFLDWRVLPASSALIIAEASLLSMALWTRRGTSSLRRGLVVPLLLVVIFLYHRSVWVAIMVSLSSLLLLRPTLLNRLFLPTMFAGLIMAFVWVVGGSEIWSTVSSAVTEPFDETSTWAWRTREWENLVPQTLAGGPVSILLGQGYGHAFSYTDTGMEIANPHNAYVQTFISAGLVGLVLLVAGYGLCIRETWKGPIGEGRHFDRTSALLLLAMLTVYSVPYSPGGEQGLLVGVLCALATRGRRERLLVNEQLAGASRGMSVARVERR